VYCQTVHPRLSLLAAVILFGACAHTVTPARSAPPCEDLSGVYLFDAQACRTSSRGLVDTTVKIGQLPNLSSLPQDRALIGIHQQGCDEIGFAIRGVGNGAWLSNDTFSVITSGEKRDASWKDGVLAGQAVEHSNLPPPIANGVRGAFYWRLFRENGNLVYVSGYSSRGFMTVIPFAGRRQSTCVLRPYSK